VDRVGVGVVGAGGVMGRLHSRTYATLAEARLVAVCDLDPAAAQAAAGATGAAVEADVAALLARDDVEAVSICTPDDLHVAPALAAARAGKHVLLEKPIATTMADARAVVSAFAGAGLTLLIGHVLRFDPRFVAAKQALDGGELGALQTLLARRVNTVAAQDRLKGRVSLPLFLGVHDYDLLRWYAGAEVREVVARSRWGLLRRAGYEVEDATTSILTFANGVMATSELGWILPRSFGPGGDHRMDLTGDAGCFKIDSLHSGVTKSTSAGNTWVDPFTAPELWGTQAGSFANELRHFLGVVRGRERPAISPDDAVAALRIALAVSDAASTGRPVVLPTDDAAPAEPPAATG
jgi:UDP-N-acetylglucosamine 3-dehydrogenase